jgi:pyruvate/2-oxoglutarate dehydrogenase complex dihydrolipoamide dehydrogenase (E3) component
MTEAEARKKAHGARLEVVRFAFHENDRAIAEGKTAGFIKVMVVRGRPVGASIVGAQAGELIGALGAGHRQQHEDERGRGMVAPYPTLMEVSQAGGGCLFLSQDVRQPGGQADRGVVQRWLP